MVLFLKQSLYPPPTFAGKRWPALANFSTRSVAILVLALSLLPTVYGQKTVDESATLISEGLIQPNQRTWVIGEDGLPTLYKTIEELEEMERRLQDASSLAVHLSTANLSLQVVGSVVDIQAQFNIESPGNNIVRRFDLKMNNCQLTEEPQFSAEQKSPTEPAAENSLVPSDEGYRWYHLSAQRGKYSIRLDAKSLVAENSDRHNIAIELPQVTTTLEIHLPPNSVEERVRNEDVVESRTVDETGVHLKVFRSRGGSFQLSWRQSTDDVQVAAVEAKCDTRYEPIDLLDPAQSWSATSNVSIRWYGSQANSKVQIALPEGSQWGPLPYLDRFRLTHLLPANENGIEVLEIENLDPIENPEVELKLQWRWLPPSQQIDRFSARLRLPVPQVRGADSTEGNIELVYPNSFQSLFKEGTGVRFVLQSRMPNLVGRQQMLFRYKGQSAFVDLTFRKEQFQPVIRPTYRVHFHENKLELTAWYKCTFDGNNTEIGLIPGGWTVDEDSACQLFEEDLPDSQESQPLLIQKLEGGDYVLSSRIADSEEEKSRSEQVWRVVAWRDYNPADKNAIQFQLPKIDRGRSLGQPVIDHGSGTLLLSSDNYLYPECDEPNSIALLRDTYSQEYAAFALPQFRQPTIYRFQRHGPTPTWKGQVRVLPRQVQTEQHAEIDFQYDRVQIRQEFQIHVANRALNELQVAVHSSAVPLTASIAGYALSFEEILSQTNPAVNGWRNFRLVGLPDILGNGQLTITSTIPWKSPEIVSTRAADAANTLTVTVPLVRPLIDEELPSRSSRWTLVPSASLDIKPSESMLRIDESNFELPSNQDSLTLAVKAKQQSQIAAVITRGTWLQTMLNGTERRDRFVARVRSKTKQIFVQLPGQAQLHRVAIDGKQLSSDAAPYDYINTRQATISLPDDQEHTVEVLYVLTRPLNRTITSVELDSAKVVDAQPQERFYWQLITPDVFHLGWCPTGLTAEWQWHWDIIAWARVSSEDQSSLEQRLTAATLAQLPASMNSYVMSGYELPAKVEVWILSRFMLWLPVGLLSISMTMLLLNVSFLRSPTSLFLLCCGLVAMALVWPDFSILLGQTAILAIGLVALIWITQAAVQSRVRRRSVFSTRPATNTDISDRHNSAARSARGQGNVSNLSPVNTD